MSAATTEAAAPAAPATTRAARVSGIDVLRGVVMVLMSIDHASEAYNRGRFFSDSAWFWTPGSPIPTAQFLTRWITHLCAPTFVFLAGVSLAMSVESRRDKGHSERDIDKHIFVRGALLVVLEVAWMSWVMIGPGKVLLQVLYAIGASLLFMIPLRRLGDRALLSVGLGLVVGIEPIVGLLIKAGLVSSIPAALLVSGGLFYDRAFIIAYPALAWLGIMCLGWGLGRRIAVWRRQGLDPAREASRVLLVAGAAGLAIFAGLRANNGFGNMALLREGTSAVQWLHVSKYPPSVTFVGLELGISALALGLLLRMPRVPRWLEPLRLIGQVALFYYLLHIHLMKLVGAVTGIEGELGIVSAYVGGLAVVIALYPLCAMYRRYKTAHPESLARFI